MKILVTGGAGFIGSHLVDVLIARGDSVVVIDDFNDFYDPEVKRSNLRKTPAKIFTADVCDSDQINSIIKAERPDVIVHLAARAGVRPSVLCPELYLKTNIFGTFNLLEAAKSFGIRKFVFASSSSVYGATRHTIQGVVNAIDFDGSPYEIFNLGENQTVELNEVIRLIEKALGKSAVIEYRPPAPGDMPQTYADISKASRLLNYRPTTLIEDGIPRFIDWFQSTAKV
jgi:nucleoside-diphosphate-sugar epimerase